MRQRRQEVQLQSGAPLSGDSPTGPPLRATSAMLNVTRAEPPQGGTARPLRTIAIARSRYLLYKYMNASHRFEPLLRVSPLATYPTDRGLDRVQVFSRDDTPSQQGWRRLRCQISFEPPNTSSFKFRTSPGEETECSVPCAMRE